MIDLIQQLIYLVDYLTLQYSVDDWLAVEECSPANIADASYISNSFIIFAAIIHCAEHSSLVAHPLSKQVIHINGQQYKGAIIY